MAHHSRLSKVVVDAPGDEHLAVAGFWAGALGAELVRNDRYPEYLGTRLPGADFGFLVQRLDEGAPRVHLDIHTDDLEAEVRRLEGLGARRVRQANSWWIMEDPVGLPFCVLQDPPGTLHDGNSHRWD